jgi:serine/threonine-protein kinase
MVKLLTLVAFSLIFAISAHAFTEDKIPDGWTKLGNNPQGYKVTIDRESAYIGSQSVLIESIKNNINAKGSVSLTQTVDAANYVGRRVSLSFYSKGASINGATGLVFQMYNSNSEIIDQVFKNFSNKEQIDYWRKTSLAVDVLESTSFLLFGVYLTGQGKVWIDNISIEVVDTNTPLTDINPKKIAKAEMKGEANE